MKRDGALIAGGFFVLYALTLLPGVGWGPGAELQIKMITEWPTRYIFGSAFQVNLAFSAFSAVTLFVVHQTVMLVASNRAAGLIATLALGFSQSFYLHAVRSSPFPVFILLASVAAYGIIRASLARIPTWPLLALLLFGVSNALILGGFLLLQFPIVGWVFGWAGVRELSRRLPRAIGVLGIVGIAAPSDGLFLADLFGRMTLASPVIAVVIGIGADTLLKRISARHESLPGLLPVLVAAVVILPLVVSASAAWWIRASGIDRDVAARTKLLLRTTPWLDPIFYTFWPPKNDQGGHLFIEEAEALLPETAVLFIDPAIAPVLLYAQRVEGRLTGIEGRTGVPGIRGKIPEDGRRIFLAGTDPLFYDLARLGEKGDIRAVGNFYELTPK